MIQILRTDSDNPDFVHLVKALDIYLAEKDGKEHAFYDQFNKIDKIRYVVLAYMNDKAVACGAIKEWGTEAMEVKRMYTLPECRGKGIAKMVLAELEKWAEEMNCTKCVLETGKRQPEAIELYKKCGYTSIPNYGQYTGMKNSVCFEKQI